MVVSGKTPHETAEFISRRLGATRSQRSSGKPEDLALIIGAWRFRLVRGGLTTCDVGQKFDICARKGGIQAEVFGVGIAV